MKRVAAAALAALALALAAPAAAGQVTVFAAASTKNALDDIAVLFAQATGHTTTLSLAGSSVLARQIRHGAPADVFISANQRWMDALEAAGRIDPATRVDLLANTLVLVAPQPDAAPLDLGTDLAAEVDGRLGDGRLAMALVDAVPAGIYGKAALETLGVWPAVAPRVAQADNVRAALAFVATGEAPLGVVYATDAAAEADVAVVATFPADSHPPIVYPAAVVAGTTNPVAAEFLAFLRRPAAREAFERRGFTVIAP